jgi:hypothetical protein
MHRSSAGKARFAPRLCNRFTYRCCQPQRFCAVVVGSNLNIPISAAVLALLCLPAMAQDRGDAVNERLDNKGDRIESRLDKRGNRIENKLDKRGDRIDRRVDRRQNRRGA